MSAKKLLTNHFQIKNEARQLRFGNVLAKCCPNGALIFLQGELGAGKTTLVRGFLQGLGYTGKVKSPTYTLVEHYEILGRSILHVDLYRLKNSNEIFHLGLLDLIDTHTLCLIEWPEVAEEQLPIADLTCYIARLLEGRELRVVANTVRGEKILQSMVSEWES